jgi:S1-C subfamily serine protease
VRAAATVALAALLNPGLEAAPTQTPPPAAQSAGGVAASGPTFRVVRSVSGSKGSVSGGRFVMDDPRSIFYLPADKQVIVYFEWEGLTGPHDFEGYWKNPDGKISAISEFKYEAREKRFGGYWTLTLSETMETGLWTLEAHVDGEITGTHAFQVLKGTAPADAVPAPRALTSAEIYKLAGLASVFVDRIDDRGEDAGRGSGFFLGDNTLVTAFQVINGASKLRITFPNGQTREGDTVLGWNRRQDWAVLEVEAPGMPHLERAAKILPAVGDSAFLLDSPSSGGRTLAETEIVGAQDYPGAGKRLAISTQPSPAAVGGALLNEYGKVIGVLGGSLLPGVSTLRDLRPGYSPDMLKIYGGLGGVLGVPIDLVTLSPTRRVTLADLDRAGVFTPLVRASDSVVIGELCKHLDRKAGFARAVDESTEFRSSDKEIYVLLSLDSKSTRKSQAALELFDVDNRRLFQSAPVKLKLGIGRFMTVDWKLTVSGLSPGFYRVDVLLDGATVWRSYLKIVD